MSEIQSNDGSPKLLRRTVIKMTAAGAAVGAAGGISGSAAAQEDGGAEIVLPAQRTNGFEVEIESATMPEGGFISLIDPVNPHEKIWPEVGETMPTEQEVINMQTIATTGYLEAGTHEGLTMELDEPLDFEHNDTEEMTGKLYQIWMHTDPDGDGEFTDVSPGDGGENRYTYTQENQHPTEVDEIVVGEAYLEYAPFNPSTLETQIQEQQNRIGELQSTIEELEAADEDNSAAVSDLESEVSSLQDNVNTLETDLEELNSTVADMDSGGGGDSIPGFGIITGIAGAAVGAAAAARRFGRDPEDVEE